MAVNWKATRDIAHATGDGWGVWLLDKDMEPVGTLEGFMSWDAAEGVNKTTTVQITLPDDHPSFPVLLPFAQLGDDPATAWRSLADSGYYIMLEGPGGPTERLTYRLARMRDEETEGRFILEGKHIHRWAELFPLWADPNRSLIYQGQYYDLRRGDSLRVLKQYLLVNMLREFQPSGVTGSDPWAAGNWAGVNPSLWAAMVNPVHQSTNTAHTVLDARFDQATDLFSETLDGAGLMLTVDLWLPGDPQPAPSHVTLTEPIFWIDIVTRQYDTSTTGDWDDFLKGLIRGFDRDDNSPVMGMGTTPATAAGVLPWVVWRPKDIAQITSDFTVDKSEFASVIVGGRSPEAVNKMIDATASITGSIIGDLIYAASFSIPIIGPVLAAVGRAIIVWFINAVGKSLQDKLFAWQRFTHHTRKALLGRFAPMVAVGAGDGYTLAAWQQGFQMLKQGGGRVGVGFQVDDQSVYEWGRHYRRGDQQGYVHRGLIFATYVDEVRLSCPSPGAAVRAQVSLGDPRTRENAVALQQRSVKSISNALHRVKTVVL